MTHSGVSNSDFPTAAVNVIKSLTSIQYSWYPYKDGSKDLVELCYRRPYTTAETCVDITAAQNATLYYFNNYAFSAGSKVIIRHYVGVTSGTKRHSDTKDKVTFNYSYNP